MNKSEASSSIKKLNTELSEVTPSTLITLFEIDISNIAFDKGIITSPDASNEAERIFRFHNNVPYLGQNIIWRGKSYTALPIKAEGFEISSQGTLPVPKLSISSNEDSIPMLSLLKIQLSKLGDLVGAKVIRIRTFYKYLDSINFSEPNPQQDSNAELPRDIFYIDRKANESRNFIEYDLASILDVEGLQLPARLVVANRCTGQYRGEGCLYESAGNRVVSIHGSRSKMPTDAPPVATEQGDLIKTLLPGIALTKKGKWARNITYGVGEYIYIEKDGIKYYFVAKTTIPQNLPPPDGRYWIADACSKQVQGCMCRWGVDPLGVAAPGRANGNPHSSTLPFLGFPACNKVR